jgi:hypothetical protein
VPKLATAIALGSSALVKKFQAVIPFVPSGIPISNTHIVLSNANVPGYGGELILNGNYNKSTSFHQFSDSWTGEYINAYRSTHVAFWVNNIGFSNAELAFDPFNQNWIIWIVTDQGSDYSNYTEQIIASNPSTNPNYIPTTGWSPVITITAA